MRRALYLKYCNKIRLTVSQYSTRIIKIKCVLSCASYIFFAVHYNYIYDCYFFFFFFWLFAQRDELEKLVEDAAIRKTAAIDVKSDPEEGHVALEGRRFKRTDTSM